MNKNEKKKNVKKAQEKLQEIARKILENPPEIRMEEKLECEHTHFSSICPKSLWYQCDNCGVVFALLDVISYRSKIDMLRDFSNMIEGYKDK